MAPRAAPVWYALVTTLLLLFWGARAEALAPHQVPEPLRPWVAWAAEVPPACPTIGENATCVWPGALELDLDDDGGRFRLEVTLDRESDVPLPGSATRWPEEVSVIGNTVAVVLEKDGAPHLKLPPGSHTVRGRFTWQALPETLSIPASVALLELRLDGKLVARPRRDKGQVWLKADTRVEEEPESLDLHVYRNLKDGVPFRIDTRLELTASGRSREVLLGNVLLPGTTPVDLEAAVPVRMEEGLLYAQIFPGKHQIRFESLLAAPPDAIARPATEAAVPFWPETEIWVWTPEGLVRHVEVGGAPGIDPAQTGLPAEWKQLAAYSVPRGGQLLLETKRRGQPDAPPNRLELQRTLWLDLDGGGYTVRDAFTGSLNRDWRLDLLQGPLGRVAVGGEDQLVTKNPVNGLSGVELRDGTLDLQAEWRFRGDVRKLRAVGWSEDVEQLGTTIHVPPGWRVLSASGVDSISETWLASWDLFALFFVLIVALSIGKLVHPGWGLLALIALVLSHDEAGAPFASWLVVVIGVALCRVVPRGWFRHLLAAATGAAGVVLGVIVLSFAVTQVRLALYPQVGHGDEWFEFGAPTEMASMEADNKEGGTGVRGDYAKSVPASAPVEQRVVQQQRDPEAVIQTGPGVPAWNWHSWQLSWSGPVHRDQVVELVLLSPLECRILALLRTLTTALLAFLLLRFAVHTIGRPPPVTPSPRAVASATQLFAPLLGIAALAWPATARADIPSAETLQDLRDRLSPPATCAPNCASVSLLQVETAENELRIRLEAHAGDTVSFQLPGPAQNWLPRRVTVGGAATNALLLGADGFLYLRLAKGRHRVEMTGPVGREVSLLLGTKPHRVEVKARDFEVDGLSSGGQVDGPLLLRRAQASEQAGEAGGVEGTVTLPVWVALSRTLDFGVAWTVRTELRRTGPVGTPASLRVPLLPGERVTTAGVVQAGQDAIVNLGRDQTEAAFDSTLAVTESLDVTASSGRNLSERWVLRCSTVWHCETTGIAPVRHQDGGHHQPEFLPWPGENLHITLRRPAPEEGRHTTVDRATLSIAPGVRLLRGDLDLGVRTSTQGSVTITLREASQVQELTVDGVAQPFARGESRLQVSLAPGRHDVRLAWQEPGGMKARFVAPPVQIDGEVVNVRVNIEVPDDRWLLFASGPSWGPAVLFWGYLLLVLLLSPVLGALPGSRLKTWQWAVLGLGLTQVPVVVGALVVGWFFAFSLAARGRPLRPVAHNFAQLGLVFYTLVFLGCLFAAVYDGLLSTPDMEVSGAGSSNSTLSWYVDRLSGALPTPVVFSTSLWVYRGAMLSWALWLSWNLLKWLRWAFEVFSADGFWKSGPKRPPPTPGGMPFSPYPVNPGPVARAGSTTPAPAMAVAFGPTGQHEAPRRERPFHPDVAAHGAQSRFEATFADEKTPIEPVALLVEKRRRAEESQKTSGDSPLPTSDRSSENRETPSIAEYLNPDPTAPAREPAFAEWSRETSANAADVSAAGASAAVLAASEADAARTASAEADSEPERETLAYSTHGERTDLVTRGDDPTRDEFEERPTLPRMDERREQEPFTFTAFDFRAAANAIDSIDSQPPVSDPGPGEWKAARTEDTDMVAATDSEREAAPVATARAQLVADAAPRPEGTPSETPPSSRVGTPPPKPANHKSDPPQAGPLADSTFNHMATPPGGFAIEELDETRKRARPPRSSQPPKKPRGNGST